MFKFQKNRSNAVSSLQSEWAKTHWLRSYKAWCLLLSGVCLYNAPTASAAPLNITYTLTAKAKVSLNIYDSNGQIVRELLHTAERSTGSKTETWDGRDDAGNVLPAGNYTWKILGTPGFGVEYVTSPGSNYPTSNTSFVDIAPGCHVGPATIAVDSTGFYIGAGSENIDATVAKQSLTGTTRNWAAGNMQAFSMPIAFGLSGTTLFNLYPSGNVYQQDTNTGAYASTWPNPPLSATYGGENPSDMTATATALVFSYPTAGVVRWLDYSGAQTRIVSVAGAKSVDLAADGTAYVISGTSLQKITPTGTSATTIVSGLTAPRRAAVNQTNGEIYVVDCAQWLGGQIKRYSSVGALLQTYGVAGGRPYGLYASQKTNFRGVSDIAVEADGKFWIAEGEAAPRRTARFNKTSTLVNEWYGGQPWAPCFAPEPDNPGYVWISS